MRPGGPGRLGRFPGAATAHVPLAGPRLEAAASAAGEGERGGAVSRGGAFASAAAACVSKGRADTVQTRPATAAHSRTAGSTDVCSGACSMSWWVGLSWDSSHADQHQRASASRSRLARRGQVGRPLPGGAPAPVPVTDGLTPRPSPVSQWASIDPCMKCGVMLLGSWGQSRGENPAGPSQLRR